MVVGKEFHSDELKFNVVLLAAEFIVDIRWKSFLDLVLWSWTWLFCITSVWNLSGSRGDL